MIEVGTVVLTPFGRGTVNLVSEDGYRVNVEDDSPYYGLYLDPSEVTVAPKGK